MMAGCTAEGMMDRLGTGSGRNGWMTRSSGSQRLSRVRGRRRLRVKVSVGGVGDVVCLVRAALPHWRSGGCGRHRDKAANQTKLIRQTSIYQSTVRSDPHLELRPAGLGQIPLAEAI
jgi:hypothetical protein